MADTKYPARQARAWQPQPQSQQAQPQEPRSPLDDYDWDEVSDDSSKHSRSSVESEHRVSARRSTDARHTRRRRTDAARSSSSSSNRRKRSSLEGKRSSHRDAIPAAAPPAPAAPAFAFTAPAAAEDENDSRNRKETSAAPRRAYDDIEPSSRRHRHRSHSKSGGTSGLRTAAPVAAKGSSGAAKSSTSGKLQPAAENKTAGGGTMPHDSKISYEPFTQHATLTNVQMALQSLIARLHLRLHNSILPVLSAFFTQLRTDYGDEAVFSQVLEALQRFYGGPKMDRLELKNMGFSEILLKVLRQNPDVLQILDHRVSLELSLHAAAFHVEYHDPSSLLHASSTDSKNQGPIVPQTPMLIDPFGFFDRLMMICIHEVNVWKNCCTYGLERSWNLQVLKDILRYCIDAAIDHFVPFNISKDAGALIYEAIEIGRKHAREYGMLTDYLKYREPWLLKCVELNGRRAERKIQVQETKDKEAKEQQIVLAQQQQWQQTQHKFQQQAELYLGRAADTLDDIKGLMERFMTMWEQQSSSAIQQNDDATANPAPIIANEETEETKQKQVTMQLVAQLLAGLNMTAMPAMPGAAAAASGGASKKTRDAKTATAAAGAPVVNGKQPGAGAATAAGTPITSMPGTGAAAAATANGTARATAAAAAPPLSNAEMRQKMLELRAKIKL